MDRETAPPASEKLPDDGPAGIGSSDGDQPNEVDDDPGNPVSLDSSE